MPCQYFYPEVNACGGLGFKTINGNQQIIFIGTTYNDEDYIVSEYGSSYDTNIYKVSDNWKTKIQEPDFNICDYCVKKNCDDKEFVLVSSCFEDNIENNNNYMSE